VEALQELPEDSGRIRLLGNLPVDGSRDYRDLKQDDEIGVTPGTVGRYILDPKSWVSSLLTVLDSTTVPLTSLGQLAVEEFLTDDYRTIHPPNRRWRRLLRRPLSPMQVQCIEREQARKGKGHLRQQPPRSGWPQQAPHQRR